MLTRKAAISANMQLVQKHTFYCICTSLLHMFTLASVELCIYDTNSTNKEKFAATWMTAAAGELLFVTDLQPSKKTLLAGNSTEKDLLVSINVAGKNMFFLFRKISNFSYRCNKLLGGCNLIK